MQQQTTENGMEINMIINLPNDQEVDCCVFGLSLDDALAYAKVAHPDVTSVVITVVLQE